MNDYQFHPVHQGDTETFAVVKGAFQRDELETICSIGDRWMINNQDHSKGNRGNRKCSLTWLERDGVTEWLYERMAEVAQCLNTQFFHYDLYGFVEAFQYVTYKEGDFFDWHIDKHLQTKAPRKLSMTVQLSNPFDYEGGDLEIRTGTDPLHLPIAVNGQGNVTGFPSWVQHRVTPVTKGVRKALVVWCAGPNFK